MHHFVYQLYCMAFLDNKSLTMVPYSNGTRQFHAFGVMTYIDTCGQMWGFPPCRGKQMFEVAFSECSEIGPESPLSFTSKFEGLPFFPLQAAEQ